MVVRRIPHLHLKKSCFTHRLDNCLQLKSALFLLFPLSCTFSFFLFALIFCLFFYSSSHHISTHLCFFLLLFSSPSSSTPKNFFFLKKKILALPVYKESNILRFRVSAVTNRETADLPKRKILFDLCDLSPDHTLVPLTVTTSSGIATLLNTQLTIHATLIRERQWHGLDH